MKRTIAGIVAGLLLGISGTAIAAGGYWQESGQGYSCEGGSSLGVICKSGGYQIGVTRSFVYIKKGKSSSAPTFACEKWRSWNACFEGP